MLTVAIAVSLFPRGQLQGHWIRRPLAHVNLPPPNSNLIDSTIFAGLTVVMNTQTTPLLSVYSSIRHLTFPKVSLCVCLFICSLHTAPVQQVWTKFGMWHPATLQMVIGRDRVFCRRTAWCHKPQWLASSKLFYLCCVCDAASQKLSVCFVYCLSMPVWSRALWTAEQSVVRAKPSVVQHWHVATPSLWYIASVALPKSTRVSELIIVVIFVYYQVDMCGMFYV